MSNFNYNFNFLCTYKNLENDDDLDSTLCYQIQLLQAFNMDTYNENILNSNIKKVYDLLHKNEEIKQIIYFLSNKYNKIIFIKTSIYDLEEIVIFNFLFSYDYFDLFHKCFSNYLNYINHNNLILDNHNNHDNNFFKDIITILKNEL